MDRMMKPEIGNNYSETQNIPSSVLQGSVLGPIKLFADDIKQLVRLLSKETSQMDLNKLSY